MINGVSNIWQNKAYINGSKDPLLSRRSSAYGARAIDNFKYYIDSFRLERVDMPDVSGLVEAKTDEQGNEIKSIDEDNFNNKMAQLDKAIEKLDEQKMPPLDFELKYSKKSFGKINKMSLLGAAYEELGRKTRVSVTQMTKSLQETYKNFLNNGDKMSAKALDLNDDDYIDVGEYAASILLNDMLDSENTQLSQDDADGIITNKGQNRGTAFAKESEFDTARETYKNIYKTFDLENAQRKFLSESFTSKIKTFLSSFFK